MNDDQKRTLELARRIKGHRIVCSGHQPLWLVLHANKFESLASSDIELIATLAVDLAAENERLRAAVEKLARVAADAPLADA